jgi:hypothetical protein
LVTSVTSVTSTSHSRDWTKIGQQASGDFDKGDLDPHTNRGTQRGVPHDPNCLLEFDEDQCIRCDCPKLVIGRAMNNRGCVNDTHPRQGQCLG